MCRNSKSNIKNQQEKAQKKLMNYLMKYKLKRNSCKNSISIIKISNLNIINQKMNQKLIKLFLNQINSIQIDYLKRMRYTPIS